MAVLIGNSKKSVTTAGGARLLSIRDQQLQSVSGTMDLFCLVNGLKSGDRNAQASFYSNYIGILAWKLRAAGVPQQDMLDLCSEVYLRVIDEIKELKSAESFQSWILKVAHSVGIDYLRRERVRGHVPLEEHHAEFRHPEEDAPTLSRLLEAVRESYRVLTDGEREALDLERWDSIADVAARTGKKTGAIKGLRSKGMCRLRNHLKRDPRLRDHLN